jgi:hypothetical protein
MRMSYDPDADAFYLSLTEIPLGAVHRIALRSRRKPDEDRGVGGCRREVDLSHLVTKGFSFEEVRLEGRDSHRVFRSGS